MTPDEHRSIEMVPVPFNPDHSQLHPHNLMASVVNGLARLELWRQQSMRPSDTLIDKWGERIATAEERHRVRQTAQDEIAALELDALSNPAMLPLLWRRQHGYHQNRAQEYAESLCTLEHTQPFFMGVRKAVLTARQTSHERKARQAAAKLLRRTDV